MKDLMILRDLEQIKAISQEYRITILEAFNYEPATAKIISEKLGEPHAKINYHIKTLVRVGILELVEEQVKLGIVEKYYCPVAKDYIVDSSSLTSSEKSVKTIEKVSIAFFEHIAKDFYNNVEVGGNNPPKKINHLQDIYLTPLEAEELNNRINSTIQEFLLDKHNPRKDADKYSVSTLLIPIIPIKK
ncbi:MAG: helix-turn-helix transcriptional regulator [Clostridiales bacterium]|nr:helix-turn-helix transcriptional regulator [Clostridiales bacterium]